MTTQWSLPGPRHWRRCASRENWSAFNASTSDNQTRSRRKKAFPRAMGMDFSGAVICGADVTRLKLIHRPALQAMSRTVAPFHRPASGPGHRRSNCVT
ncbi:hypothetical protein N015_09695 [Pseudomonas asturiensis]|uniref:Uncharacterized protein n=1 Tax=Pseudomonas asturiensis TaxID=1190415 RepID=A0ABX6HAQ2_9PSED|nr:hypothetical protein N015_09695 [Pseudomonas asturiensis]